MIDNPSHTRTLIRFFLASLMLSGAAAPAQQNESENPTDHGQATGGDDRLGWALQSEDEAIARAREYMGLTEGTESPAMTAQLTTLATDNTPFLSGQLVGRPIWKVVIGGWRLKIKSRPDAEDRYARTFDVFLDPVDGRLLKILSRWPKDAPKSLLIPSAALAEQQMHRVNSEEFHDFPNELPQVTFLDALDIIATEGVGSPYRADQILAHYVIASYTDRDPAPIWSITVRAIRQYSGSSPSDRTVSWSEYRNIIYAQTGEWLWAGNTPRPRALPGTKVLKKRTGPGR